MKCQYCNSNIPENVQVCPVCGAISPTPAAGNTATFPSGGTVEYVTPFTALKKYAEFSGRARRKEYWLFKLLTLPVMIVGQLVMIGRITSPGVMLVVSIISLYLIVPEIAVFCRRMHDVGKSGWMWLWHLLPLAGVLVPIGIVGAILSLISMGVLLFYEVKDSEPGTNKYGDNPKGK